MRHCDDIIVCGDVHGMWKYLNKLINQKKPTTILQVGDFGWWPGKKIRKRTHNGMRIAGFDPLGVKAGNTEVFFCPGNHEHWDDLDLRTSNPCELIPNVFYMRRGSTMTLPDGRVVLFMGGALSIDRHSRTHGIDWFPQEMIPISELYKLEESGPPHVDIVISHTSPQEFNPILNNKRPYNGWEYKFWDSSQEVLSEILYMYKPSLWYFGHFHINMEGFHKETDTYWYAMNEVPGSQWWRYLNAYGT